MEAFDRLTSWQPPAWLARLLGIGVSPSGTGNDTSTAGDATGSEGVGSKVRRGMGLGTAAAGQKAIDYFVSQGWTPQQAAGIAGNLQQESSFDPQSGVKEQSSHRGIAQWDASRRAGIEKQFGVSVDRMSYDQQLAAVQWELTHGEHRAAGDRLRQETTAGGSAVSVAHNFEIPVAGNDPDAAAKWAKEEAWRRQYAEQHFKAYPGAGQRNLDSNRLLADARPEVNRYGGLWDRPYPQAPRLSVQTGGITVPPLPDEHGFFKDTPTTLDRLRVALARPAARPEPVVAPELAPPAAIRPAAYAVPTAAQRWGSATVHHTEHHDNRSEMHVGPVTVHTQAKDAHGIARDMDAALRARNMAAQANRGLR